jgi:hypothetical protein
MTMDASWTRFVRAWREISREHLSCWRESSDRLRLLVDRHPLPWALDQDWTWEVLASDGTCVGKFMTSGEAARFIALAEAAVARQPRRDETWK